MRKLFVILLLIVAILATGIVSHYAFSADLGQTKEKVQSGFRQFWHFELFKIRGSYVEISQVVIVIILLIAGIWLSSLFSRFIYRRLLRFTDNSTAVAFRQLLFYVLVVTVVLIALEVVQIPLTFFAFFGGALAIGVGFGAQNIVNNFISGLILIFERPIRIGDLLEIDGHNGRVARIRYRYTLIKQTNGVDLLVPNSYLLEKNVTNWTLSDKRIRTSVSVGVAYGSPTREVTRLIRQAVDEHEQILKQPKPFILFESFGDNSLLFEVHFWSEVKNFMALRLIRSDLRYRIDDLFREASITIAFPQRDVHLDTLGKPLEVKVLQE